MKKLFIAFIYFVGFLWLSGSFWHYGASQAMAQQQETAQAQKSLPGYAGVAAVLTQHCTVCHSGAQAPLDLRLDNYADLMAGSRNGPVILPGNPERSELMRRIRGTSQPRMPLTGPPWLSDHETELIERWIADGAAEGEKSAPPEKTGKDVPAQTEVKDQPLTYARVAPVFGSRCVKCHMINGLMGPPPEGYRLDTYEAMLDSRERARIIPGNPDASELIRRIRGQSLPRMPFDGPPYLTDAQIELLSDWVRQGARDTNGDKAAVPAGARVRLQGRLGEQWVLDGLPLVLDRSVRLKKAPGVGSYVEVRGLVEGDGSIRATRIRARK